MDVTRKSIVLAACAAMLLPTAATSAIERAAPGDATDPRTATAPAILECVPYARQLSGIRIFGDAHTWWKQASGRYARGSVPRVGAVMAVKPHNNSRLGHVATVSRVIDSRTILLSHANWSYRGGIERNVTALDVSTANDWSEVRIWYGPARNLGVTHWPVAGFIYNARPGALPDLGSQRLAEAANPTKAEKRETRQRRRSDPIGAIIAGTYRN